MFILKLFWIFMKLTFWAVIFAKTLGGGVDGKGLGGGVAGT